MNFSSIIYKNLKHNFKKYMSLFFVNSFIISIIFMYGSLVFNTIIIKELGKSIIFENMKAAFGVMVLFSIAFISYTSISFMKYRGKEFGVYLTLGMTTKDLRKMLFLENIVIVITSLITGILTGLIFSRLFHMAIGKILSLKNNIYEINYKTFLLSIGVFLIIFAVSMVFGNIYIHRLSIIDVMKSSAKKEIGKTNAIFGAISLIIFIISLYLFPEAIFQRFLDGNRIAIGTLLALILICPYFIIGTIVGLVKSIAKKFPNLYNDKLLVLSNLSHRFLAYKTVLYLVSILVGGAIFFIGFTYSLYSLVEEQNSKDNPYDIMFVEENKYNNIDPNFVEKVVKNNGGELEKYSILESLKVTDYRDVDGQVCFYVDKRLIISENNYNNHMHSNIDVKPGELTQITIYKEKEVKFAESDVILALDGPKKVNDRRNLFDKDYYAPRGKFFETIKKDDMMIFPKNKKNYMSASYINSHHNPEYNVTSAFILSNEDYDKIKLKLGKDFIFKSHLINIKSGDKRKIYNAIVSELKKVNGFSENQWDSTRGSLRRAQGIEAYKPIFKYDVLQRDLEDNGFNFFTMLFLGLTFLISSGVVLYHKVITDIDNERERIESISRIGTTHKELRKVLSSELRIIFFVPVLIGCGLGVYFISIMYTNSALKYFLMQRTFIVVGVYVLLQIIFYLISRNKYLNEVFYR